MTLLAAVSQVKCAAVTIILMPACQNASATKCCCQPRGIISLARVPLIITGYYQLWLHLLTRLSVAGRSCIRVRLGVSDSSVLSVYFGKRTQDLTDVKCRHKVVNYYNNTTFIQRRIKNRSPTIGICIFEVDVDCR